MTSDIEHTPVLHSTGCIACRELKEELDANGIKYIENNDVKKMLDLGFDKVPMLEIAEGKFLDYNESINWIRSKGEKI